jgi:hypothetical protein
LLLILLFIFLTPLRIASRHCGFISILLFISLWLSKSVEQKALFNSDTPFLTFPKKNIFLTSFFGSILVVQLFGGFIFLGMDVMKSFSAAKETALYVNTLPQKEESVALSHFTAGPAVTLYCQRKLFYLENDFPGTFCKWNTTPLFLRDTELLNRLKSFMSDKKECFFICSVEGKMNALEAVNSTFGIIENLHVKLLRKFENSVIQSERYYVYSLKAY